MRMIPTASATRGPTWIRLGALLAASFLLSGCGADPVAVPDVTGIRLDDAHNALAAKGFEKFEDADNFGDRSVLLDSNWAVIKQDPPGGSRAPTGDAVTLMVGKIGEVRTRDALTSGSPVLADMLAKEAGEKKRAAQQAADKAASDAKKRAEQEARKVKDAAERVAAAKKYVDGIDPATRLAVANHVELAKLRRQVSARSVTGDELTLNVSAATQALTMLEVLLDGESPSSTADLDAEHAQLMSAVSGFKRAAVTLLSADSTGRAAALDRFDVVYQQARTDWNAALTQSYVAGKVSNPPLVPK